MQTVVLGCLTCPVVVVDVVGSHRYQAGVVDVVVDMRVACRVAFHPCDCRVGKWVVGTLEGALLVGGNRAAVGVVAWAAVACSCPCSCLDVVAPPELGFCSSLQAYLWGNVGVVVVELLMGVACFVGVDVVLVAYVAYIRLPCKDPAGVEGV